MRSIWVLSLLIGCGGGPAAKAVCNDLDRAYDDGCAFGKEEGFWDGAEGSTCEEVSPDVGEDFGYNPRGIDGCASLAEPATLAEQERGFLECYYKAYKAEVDDFQRHFCD